MSQNVQDLIDYSDGIQNTQHPPSTALDDSGTSHPSAMIPPENTDTQSLPVDTSAPAGSSAVAGEGTAQEVDELGTVDLLLPVWNPSEMNQQAAETDGASGGSESVHTNAAASPSTVPAGANDPEATGGANGSENPIDPTHLQVVISGGTTPDGVYITPSSGTVIDSSTGYTITSFAWQPQDPAMPYVFTAAHLAMLASAGVPAAHAETVITAVLGWGSFRWHVDDAVSREEAVAFVAGLERVEVAGLAVDDRDCGICRGGCCSPAPFLLFPGSKKKNQS